MVAAMRHPRAGETYRAPEYWGQLHDAAEDLAVVGYPTLPLVFNRHVYANAARAVLRGLDATGTEVLGRSVLDIGSGTGFWVDLWRREGAAMVAGSDLVPGAVDKLRERFPDCAFEQADIAARAPFPGRTFDLVTIMSVLHHVIDEDRFEKALLNLASKVAPGGRLIVLDGLVVRGRWMPPAAESAHNVTRTLSQWERALDDTGLRLAHIAPTASFLGDPIDGGSRLTFAAQRLWWRGFTRTIRGRDRLASAVVPPLAAIERAILPRLRAGSSSKLLVLEHGN